jgi:NADPH-dependent 2,4-dienoyl-CoA reductase/sulfur reductase-like enzyme
MRYEVPRFDVVIIGAGPAGIRAAETLSRHGITPILLDEAPRCGGQIYRQPPAGAERSAYDIYGLEARKAAAIHAVPGERGERIDYRPETLVWNVARTSDKIIIDTLKGDVVGRIVTDRLLIATGAVDRVLPFPGWTLPGVFTLGAAQIALKSQGVAVGRRVALVGAGPLLPLLASQYLKAGVEPVAVLDVTPFLAKVWALPRLMTVPLTLLKGVRYSMALMRAGIRQASGVRGLRVLGTDRVTGLVYQDRRGAEHEIACDAVAASFGLRSETQLADLAGCRFVYDATTRQWQPWADISGRTSVALVYVAGDGAAIGGADVAELAGERAAFAILEDTGVMVDGDRISRLEMWLDWQSGFRRGLEAAYPFPAHLVAAITPDTTLCRCEGVSAGEVQRCVREQQPTDVNRLKAFTRVGMGRCQGRMCGLAAAELLAYTNSGFVEAAGRLRAQPPIKPIPVQLTSVVEPAA